MCLTDELHTFSLTTNVHTVQMWVGNSCKCTRQPYVRQVLFVFVWQLWHTLTKLQFIIQFILDVFFLVFMYLCIHRLGDTEGKNDFHFKHCFTSGFAAMENCFSPSIRTSLHWFSICNLASLILILYFVSGSWIQEQLCEFHFCS